MTKQGRRVKQQRGVMQAGDILNAQLFSLGKSVAGVLLYFKFYSVLSIKR